jgi:hypothetical protein
MVGFEPGPPWVGMYKTKALAHAGLRVENYGGVCMYELQVLVLTQSFALTPIS